MLQRRYSPMEYDGQRMPIESFHDLWRTPGFKYEYGHGRVNISVQRSAAPIMVTRPSTIKESVSGTGSSLSRAVVGSAHNASVEELERLWIDAFVRTPDFYGYSVEDIQKEGAETLALLYGGESPDLHPCSVIATWEDDLVGMLLVNKNRPRPVIEALGVRPDFQRRGVGKAMAEAAAERLRGNGEHVLCSGYLLANDKSAAWHEEVGFLEIPDWLTTQHRLRCAEHNLERGLVRDAVGTKRYVEMLRSDVNRMSQDREEDPSAHCPFRWIRSDGERIDDYLAEHAE